ncbi:MAG: MBL fold metallo-hydrolase [Chitinispirillaceae bacterium]|nr:MBL fold metallo-hydrolase [Chitinispirillaceae bacterium]
MITVHRFTTGPIETNTWLVDNGGNSCMVIDPAFGCEEIVQKIRKEAWSCEAILLTHSHFDHITGVPEIHDSLGPVPVYIHPLEAPYLANAQLNGSAWFGDEFSLDITTGPIEEGRVTINGFSIDVRHVPGHTPGGCAFIIDTCCFCGDSLFAGSIGRSDLPGGNGPELIASIKTKLLTLPDGTAVCPGHGGRTTIGRERKSNPFVGE